MGSEDQNKEYLAPDYTGYPREEDDDDVFVEEIDEDELRIEKLLEEQEQLNEKLDNEREEYEERRQQERMSNANPFSSGSSPWNSGTKAKAPWEEEEPQKTWSPGGSGGSFWSGGSGWGAKPAVEEKPNQTVIPRNTRKRAVICDLLDCLYESWDSGGRPNIMPRAMFDLKPKFDVWDKIASFAPERVYVIFPAAELLPSLGDPSCRQATVDYITRCLSTYFRLDWRRGVCFLHQMQKWTAKEKSLAGAIKDWKNNKDEIVYIGTHSGRWGLSSRDLDAAHTCGVDYIDMYNLLDGKYEYE